jgi:hypothetical protein
LNSMCLCKLSAPRNYGSRWIWTVVKVRELSQTGIYYKFNRMWCPLLQTVYYMLCG